MVKFWGGTIVSVGKNLFIVLMGAALGAALRLGAEWVLHAAFDISASYSLLAVNALGCIAFAYCSAVLAQQKAKLFWLTGCWGTFTSFSALGLIFLLMEASVLQYLTYGVVTVLTWGVAFVVGQQLGHYAVR